MDTLHKKDLGLDLIKDFIDDRVATARLASSEQVYIYSGRSFELSDLDDPGTILTNLQKHHFSHVETFGKTTELVIKEADGKEARIVFLNGAMDRFKIQLGDQSYLDILGLDEHIHIAV